MTNKKRYFISMTIALIISLVVGYFYAQINELWVMLTAIYVMQTSIGSEFYQGVKRFLVISLLVFIAAIVMYSMRFFYQVMHDVIMGAVIGILANMFIFPRRADKEFRAAILPVVRSYNDYFTAIIDLLIQKNTQDRGNAVLENHLQALPDWVYVVGFDGGLQAGYRFFLMKLEQMSNVLFAMHHLARYEYEKELIAKIREPLLQCAEHVNQFFIAMITVLELEKVTEKVSGLEEEIAELEKQFQIVVPLSLELLDMKPDYVYLAEFVYYFKDLRRILLKMDEALR
jgi:hypothetical protein